MPIPLPTAFLATLLLTFVSAMAQDKPPAPPSRDDHAAEQLGWRLAVQAWTFRDRTAFEAIDTAQRLGLRYIELYPDQAMSPEHRDVKVGVDMTDAERAALLAHLQERKVQLVNFGVVGIRKDEAKSRELFAFAKAMGIETLTCEPDADAWDLAEKLADEYQINLACHDHPKPAPYWSPATVLQHVDKRSKRLGACADTGHWPRSGLDAIACLDQLKGRIVCLHFKDIAPLAHDGVDKPWGTGDADAPGMLRHLREQGFRGVFSIEYETGSGTELEQNVAACIRFFDQQARELLARPADKAAADKGADK